MRNFAADIKILTEANPEGRNQYTAEGGTDQHQHSVKSMKTMGRMEMIRHLKQQHDTVAHVGSGRVRATSALGDAHLTVLHGQQHGMMKL